MELLCEPTFNCLSGSRLTFKQILFFSSMFDPPPKKDRHVIPELFSPISTKILPRQTDDISKAMNDDFVPVTVPDEGAKTRVRETDPNDVCTNFSAKRLNFFDIMVHRD